MAAKTTSGSGFRPFFYSPPSTWSSQVKISEYTEQLYLSPHGLHEMKVTSMQSGLGHFFEIFGVKVENFKNYLNELQDFCTRHFLIFCSRCGHLPLCQNLFTFVQ